MARAPKKRPKPKKPTAHKGSSAGKPKAARSRAVLPSSFPRKPRSQSQLSSSRKRDKGYAKKDKRSRGSISPRTKDGKARKAQPTKKQLVKNQRNETKESIRRSVSAKKGWITRWRNEQVKALAKAQAQFVRQAKNLARQRARLKEENKRLRLEKKRLKMSDAEQRAVLREEEKRLRQERQRQKKQAAAIEEKRKLGEKLTREERLAVEAFRVTTYREVGQKERDMRADLEEEFEVRTRMLEAEAAGTLDATARAIAEEYEMEVREVYELFHSPDKLSA